MLGFYRFAGKYKMPALTALWVLPLLLVHTYLQCRLGSFGECQSLLFPVADNLKPIMCIHHLLSQSPAPPLDNPAYICGLSLIPEGSHRLKTEQPLHKIRIRRTPAVIPYWSCRTV